MTIRDITSLRLHLQQLTRPVFTKPGEVVSWLGAVQAQDYFGALWSVGQRVKKAVEADVEKAIAGKALIRTWPMRGTLHFVHPKYVRWMLTYLTPRVIARMANYYRRAELDEKVFTKSKKLWIKALEGGKQLTRDKMYAVLERGKISTAGMRGLFILGYVAQKGIICFGARKGKQQTFALLDEWLPPAAVLKKEVALGELAQCYFKSRGPATIEDFMWWAGITRQDATLGLGSVKSNFISETVEARTYWFPAVSSLHKTDGSKAFLLPTYDEYGIAYKDRSAILQPSGYKKVGGLFTSAIVINGKAIGLWRRTIKKDTVTIETKAFSNFSTSQRKAIESATDRYSSFIGKYHTVKWDRF